MTQITAKDSARFWRIAFLTQALLVGLSVIAVKKGWHDWSKPFGMVQQPCGADQLPVSGKPQEDWAAQCMFRAANAELKASGIKPKAVFIGDSLTVWWAGSEKRLFTPDVINRGIGGQTSAQLLLRFDQDVVALRPSLVHILVGINDVAGLKGPIAPDMYQSNIRAMVDLAQANGIAVVLGTIPPAREFVWQPHLKPMPWQAELNRWIIDFGKQRGIVVADYAAVLSQGAGVIRPEFYKKDGIHLTDSGYAAIYLLTQQALADAAAKVEAKRPR